MPNRFPYVKKGYDPDKVDEKIETLEEVIRSYKSKDSAIKNAILNAQIAADNIIQNAKNQAQEIKSEAAVQLSDIKLSISFQRDMLKQFENEYMLLVSKYLHAIPTQDFSEINKKISDLEAHIESLNRAETPIPEKIEEPEEF